MRRSAPIHFGSVRVRTPTIASGQRIGIMGGTFNPPHAGHVLISETAIKRLRLDQLWWLVTPGNPLKSNGGLPPLQDRIAACRAMVHDPRIKITGFEATLGTPYTAATLAFLTRRFPTARFVWVMGADNLAGFHRWQHWREIMQLMPVAVVDRPGWRHRAIAAKSAQTYRKAYVPDREAICLTVRKLPAWTLLAGPLSELSSTALRAAGHKVARHGDA